MANKLYEAYSKYSRGQSVFIGCGLEIDSACDWWRCRILDSADDYWWYTFSSGGDNCPVQIGSNVPSLLLLRILRVARIAGGDV